MFLNLLLDTSKLERLRAAGNCTTVVESRVKRMDPMAR